MSRALVRSLLARWDAAGAAVRSYAAESEVLEPSPTIPEWLQAQLTRTERTLADLAAMRSLLEARGADLAARDRELARLEAEREREVAARMQRFRLEVLGVEPS